MKCFHASVFFMMITRILIVTAAEIQIRDELQTVAEQLSILRTQCQSEIDKMKKEVDDLR